MHFPERVVQKSLSQNALVPAIVPTLIAANSANIKGRGTDYALKLLKRTWPTTGRRHGREGYILLGDFSDYFARIAHQPVKDQVASALLDPRVVALEHRLIGAQGDVGLGLGSEAEPDMRRGPPQPHRPLCDRDAAPRVLTGATWTTST